MNKKILGSIWFALLGTMGLAQADSSFYGSALIGQSWNVGKMKPSGDDSDAGFDGFVSLDAFQGTASTATPPTSAVLPYNLVLNGTSTVANYNHITPMTPLARVSGGFDVGVRCCNADMGAKIYYNMTFGGGKLRGTFPINYTSYFNLANPQVETSGQKSIGSASPFTQTASDTGLIHFTPTFTLRVCGAFEKVISDRFSAELHLGYAYMRTKSFIDYFADSWTEDAAGTGEVSELDTAEDHEGFHGITGSLQGNLTLAPRVKMFVRVTRDWFFKREVEIGEFAPAETGIGVRNGIVTAATTGTNPTPAYGLTSSSHIFDSVAPLPISQNGQPVTSTNAATAIIPGRPTYVTSNDLILSPSGEIGDEDDEGSDGTSFNVTPTQTSYWVGVSFEVGARE